MQLRSDLDTATALSPHERALPGDRLDRLADGQWDASQPAKYT